MKTVYYELYHICGEDTENTDEIVKFLGVFTSARKAKEAMNFLVKQKEFCIYPKKSFSVYKVKVDQYEWKEGFCTAKEAMEYQQEKENQL